MQNFFVYDSQVQGENIYIEGTDVNHIVHVLRMKVGEEVSVHDDVNRKYLCRIEKLLEERVVLSIVEQQESDTELSCPIYLFQGLPKGDKMEWIIQKCVELGRTRNRAGRDEAGGCKAGREESAEKSEQMECHRRECGEAVRKRDRSGSTSGDEMEGGAGIRASAGC